VDERWCASSSRTPRKGMTWPTTWVESGFGLGTRWRTFPLQLERSSQQCQGARQLMLMQPWKLPLLPNVRVPKHL
jgi:hypothetical protein